MKIEKLLETNKAWNGQEIGGWPKGKPVTRVLKYTVPPKTDMDWHTHPIPNVAHVLKGELTVEIKDGVSQKFKAGDTFEEVVNIVHRGRNLGTEEIELIVFYASTEDSNDIIKQETP